MCTSRAIACTALQRRAWTVRWGALIAATRNVWARAWSTFLFPGSVRGVPRPLALPLIYGFIKGNLCMRAPRAGGRDRDRDLRTCEL